MVKHVQDFKAGEEAPEWLLSADPKSAQSVRPRIRFGKDVSLVEKEGAYWLLVSLADTQVGGFIVLVDDGRDCQINATTLPVIVPGSVFVIYSEDVDATAPGRQGN